MTSSTLIGRFLRGLATRRGFIKQIDPLSASVQASFIRELPTFSRKFRWPNTIMSSRTLPLLFINLGGEMLYILDQRLRAQNIPVDKAKKGS